LIRTPPKCRMMPSAGIPEIERRTWASAATVLPDCRLYRYESRDLRPRFHRRPELREYCSRRGWTFTREYVDTDWGNGRPEFDRLMQDAALHWLDLVLVWRLDRFGRYVRHSIQKLRALSSWGIQFIATNQGYDTRQEVPTNRLLLPIMTAVANFEREMMGERVKAGIDAARKTGVKLGRPKAAFDRKKAAAMRRRGLSLRAIAAELGVSKGAVERLVGTASLKR